MSDELRPEVVVGDPVGDHLSIRVLGRLHPGSDDFWDGNWLATPIDVVVGKFRGTIGASLRADELQRFREAIEKLHASLDGDAVLESMEDWISLKVTAEPSGGLVMTGTIVDRLGDGNRLTFRIDGVDQSYLPAIIDALDEVETFFPVLGSP